MTTVVRASVRTTAFTIVGTGETRSLVAYDVAQATPLMEPVVLDGMTGTVSLAPANKRLVIVDSDTSIARVFDTAEHKLLDELRLPVQVAPTSLTAVPLKPRHIVVINRLSNSLTVIDGEVVQGTAFDLTELVGYRRKAVEAFADLVGRFGQYLKDCVFDHLLVRCPPRQENKDLDLAAVSIRGGSVYKVCNFARRRYVKSFPTVGYWLSLVPLLPYLRKLLVEFGCAILPDLFGKYSTANHDQADDRVGVAQLLQLLETAQAQDPLSLLRSGKQTLRSAGRLAATGQWTKATTKLGLSREPRPPEPTPTPPIPQDTLATLQARLDTLESELAALKRRRSPSKPAG